MELQPLTEISGIAPPGGHYSHAVVANGMVFVSGQLPISPAGERLANVPFEQQAEQALANVSAILRSCGAALTDLVQVRVYIDDVKNWSTFNEVYSKWTGAWKPARTVVPVASLHYGLKIEVEAVAILRPPQASGQ